MYEGNLKTEKFIISLWLADGKFNFLLSDASNWHEFLMPTPRRTQEVESIETVSNLTGIFDFNSYTILYRIFRYSLSPLIRQSRRASNCISFS